MRAAVVLSPGAQPTYTNNFPRPEPKDGFEVVTVHAAALTHLTKARALHSSGIPVAPSFVPGMDGVGVTVDGRRVYFVMPELPFGAIAEQSLVSKSRCIELSSAIDDTTAAALANPGMSALGGVNPPGQHTTGGDGAD